MNSAINAKLLAYETEICCPILLIIMVTPSNRYHKGMVEYRMNEVQIMRFPAILQSSFFLISTFGLFLV